MVAHATSNQPTFLYGWRRGSQNSPPLTEETLAVDGLLGESVFFRDVGSHMLPMSQWMTWMNWIQRVERELSWEGM